MDSASLFGVMNTHARWVTTIINYIAGEGPRPVSDELDDATCEMGRWLAGDGRRYGDLESYRRLHSVHAALHGAAREIVELADRGERRHAFDRMRPGTPFANLSVNFIMAFDDLECAIRTDSETGGRVPVSA